MFPAGKSLEQDGRTASREAIVAKKIILKQAHYIAADQLRIGLYIFIDRPWFDHPFTLNSFRITSKEQIAALMALGETRFRYDPERSLVAYASGSENEVAVSITSPPFPPEGQASAPDLSAPDFPGKNKRIEILHDHRQRIEQVNRSFLKSVSTLRHLNRNLLKTPEETLREMKLLVEQMVLSFLEHPEVTLHHMGEECGGEEVYSHSLNVTVLSMMLTKGLGFTPDQARTLGLGALLHDIGLMELPSPLLRKHPDEFTRPERDLRALHCEYGLRMGKQLDLPPDVLAIIFQHHEMIDGSGYPLGIKKDKIALPARVVALVNAYDNLCNTVDPNQAMTPHEALSLLFGQRRSKFDADVMQRMIRCLGVYPPGSIVTLSNDAIALVMSVNPVRPLRPWVMVYDENVPKEEAILLDLERETEINIVKALRPALLPPPIYAYLSPRKRVAYYFDSSDSPGQVSQ